MKRPPIIAARFVRWRPQVLQFWAGVNIYDKMIFPNPPIMPITLYPLMVLPTVTGAMCWFAIKVVLTTAALVMLFQIVRPPGRSFPPMFRSLVLASEPAADPGRSSSRQQQSVDPVPGRGDVLRLAARVTTSVAGLLLGLATVIQGDAGSFLRLFRLQAIVADRRLGPAGAGDIPADRPQRGDRPRVQRRVPGDVVAPHGDAVRRQGRGQSAGDQPVVLAAS